MTDELKPCPFCPDGGEPKMTSYMADMHIAKCTECGCHAGNIQMTPELAAQNWNTRYKRTCQMGDAGGFPSRENAMKPRRCTYIDSDGDTVFGICHGFGFKAWTHGAAVNVGGFTAGQESHAVAIVEHESDGTIEQVPVERMTMLEECDG